MEIKEWFASKDAELKEALYDLGEGVMSALANTDPISGWEISLLSRRLDRVNKVYEKDDYVSDPDSEPLGN